MPLPDYIVIGAPKSGTSSVCMSLFEHPNVYMPASKELNFFNRYYERGLDWYSAQFADAPKGVPCGDGSPGYSLGRKTPVYAKRMATDLPDVKLIYLVRDPLRRIESHFVQNIDDGIENETLSGSVLNRGLCNTSKYFERLNDYLAHYPREQVFVGFFEELIASPEVEFKRILDFIGVEPAGDDSDFSPMRKSGGREEKTRQTSAMKFLRRQPWYDSVNRLAPRALINRVKPLLRRPIDAAALKPTWTNEALDFAVHELKDDVAAFLAFTGRSASIWPHFHKHLAAAGKNGSRGE